MLTRSHRPAQTPPPRRHGDRPRCRSPRSGSANTTPTIRVTSEFAVAILSLSTDRTAERDMRVLQVLKLRGSGYLTYRLTQHGLDVCVWPTPSTTDNHPNGCHPESRSWTACSPTATGGARPPSSPDRRSPRTIRRHPVLQIRHLPPSDNVVLLQFLRGESELKRAITVLKTRGSAHVQQLRQFDITPDGVTLGEQFDPRQSPR